MTGAPSAPKATGAVLKISTKTSASSGGKPTRISSELVIATGVPKPATPSSSAPKQKPIDDQDDAAVVGQMVDQSSAGTRRSGRSVTAML